MIYLVYYIKKKINQPPIEMDLENLKIKEVSELLGKGRICPEN